MEIIPVNIQAETVTVNGIEYVKKGGENSAPIGTKRIIVADRGWVFVGDCIDNEDGTITIHNAKNIRSWGTTKGLGQLKTGPVPDKTVYDDYGTVRCEPIVQINVVSGW